MSRLTGIAGVSPVPEVTHRIPAVNSATADMHSSADSGDYFRLMPFSAGTGGTPAVPVRRRLVVAYNWVFLMRTMDGMPKC